MGTARTFALPSDTSISPISRVLSADNGWLPGAREATSLNNARGLFEGLRARPTTSNERYKAYSMSGFREPGFADRQKAAQQAKQNIVNKFRTQPGYDDPEVVKRRAERETIAANREKARLAREAEKAEAKRAEEEA